MTYTTSDVTAWAVHDALQTLDWTLDSLSCNGVDTDRDEFDAIDTARRNLQSAAGLVDAYSDGRPIETRVWIADNEIRVSHLWHYRPSNKGESLLFTGKRLADPGEDNGSYSVFANPSTCTLRVELLDPTPRPRLIQGGAE